MAQCAAEDLVNYVKQGGQVWDEMMGTVNLPDLCCMLLCKWLVLRQN